MALKELHIITVGKPHFSFWKEAGEFYLKRLSPWRKVMYNAIRDSDASLSIQKRKEDEGKRILSVLSPSELLVCMDEHGKNLSSVDFSVLLNTLSENSSFTPCFLIGGPFGIHSSVLSKAKYIISFGKQTVTHELALVLLLEQLYRAETIIRKIPYHHE